MTTPGSWDFSRPGGRRLYHDRFTPRPAVRWYSPSTLWRSIAGIVGQRMWSRYGDPRTDYARTPHRPHSMVERDDTVWIDYAADLGDGFDGAYAVLSGIQDDGDDQDGEPTKPGDILILGGDQVYPTPSDDEYRDRLLGPIWCAHPEPDEPPRLLFSIPGNHDYYDRLKTYTNALVAPAQPNPTPGDLPVGVEDSLTAAKWVGGYGVIQQASYWVVTLPHDWVLVGADFGVDHKLDAEQQVFITRAVEQAAADGARPKCVLIVATPLWLYGREKASRELASLERQIALAGGLLAATVAGDRHCYMRHESQEIHDDQDPPPVRITAGLAGAFLHQPKIEPEQPIFDDVRYHREAIHPDHGWSDRFKLTNPVRFAARNLSLAWITAPLALAAGLLWLWAVGKTDFWSNRLDSPVDTLTELNAATVTLGVIVVVGLGFLLPPPDAGGLRLLPWRVLFAVVFTGFTSGAIWVTHVASVGLTELFVDDDVNWGVAWTLALFVPIGTFLLMLAMGCVLWTHALAGASSTPVFGGAREGSPRGWLRLKVDEDGLTAYLFAIERVPTIVDTHKQHPLAHWADNHVRGPLLRDPDPDERSTPRCIDQFRFDHAGRRVR